MSRSCSPFRSEQYYLVVLLFRRDISTDLCLFCTCASFVFLLVYGGGKVSNRQDYSLTTKDWLVSISERDRKRVKTALNAPMS